MLQLNLESRRGVKLRALKESNSCITKWRELLTRALSFFILGGEHNEYKQKIKRNIT